jgi:hypothetical protein
MTGLATHSSGRTTTTSSARQRRASACATAPASRVGFDRSRSPHLRLWGSRAGSDTARVRSSYRLPGALAVAATVATLASGSTSTSHAAGPSPYSAHSMVYTCCTPRALKERMFSEAKALRSSYIRLDVEIGPIFEY